LRFILLRRLKRLTPEAQRLTEAGHRENMGRQIQSWRFKTADSKRRFKAAASRPQSIYKVVGNVKAF
jgi:hypothetical protein